MPQKSQTPKPQSNLQFAVDELLNGSRQDSVVQRLVEQRGLDNQDALNCVVAATEHVLAEQDKPTVGRGLRTAAGGLVCTAIGAGL